MHIFFICSLAVFASGCATRDAYTLANLPLPKQQSQNCCWQALQQLDITYDQQHYELTGALAETSDGVTLVLLDPFGRRLLSANKQGDVITTYRSPELPKDLPEQFLLASSMLVWWPLTDWQYVLEPSNTDWKISVNSTERILAYRGKNIVRASYAPNSTALTNGMNNASVGQTMTLKHEHQPLVIHVTTQSLDTITQSPRN